MASVIDRGPQHDEAGLRSAYQHLRNAAPRNMPFPTFDEMLQQKTLKAILVARLKKPLINTKQHQGQMPLFS